MGSIDANLVRRMIAAADDSVSADELLAIVGLDSVTPDPTRPQPVPDEAAYAMLERATRDGDHRLPLRYGDALEPGMVGALGHAMATASTVGDALRRLARYVLVISDTLEYELRTVDGGAEFHLLGRTGPRRGTQLANECAVAAITSVLRRVAISPVHPSSVTFRHAPPPTTSDHERWFNCPVHFEAPATSLCFSGRTLTTRTRLGDAGLSAYLLAQLDDLHAEQSERSALQRVRAAVADNLCDGVPTKADIARRLGMSDRTLHRRLADQDETFQAVVDQVRFDIARSLLTDSDRPLGEVAYFTGFAAQSGFNRAFKRWTGQTPLAYRRGVG